MKKKRHQGQAVVEYLLIFVLVAGISFGFFRALQSTFSTVFTQLAMRLSQKLSTGNCAKNCLENTYVNQITNEGDN